MRKTLVFFLILVLVLMQLCACAPTSASGKASSAAEPESAPAVRVTDEPDEPLPEEKPAQTEDTQAPVSLPTPDRVLTSSQYSVEIYSHTTQQYRSEVESREYVVSDGVTVTAYRATGLGGSLFFDHTLTGSGTIWYYDLQTGQWISQALAAGEYASPVAVVALASGAAYFFALPRTYVLHENDTKEYLPELDGTLNITETGTGFHLTVNGYGLHDGRVTDALILTSPVSFDWELENCARTWVKYGKDGSSQWCYDGYYRQCPSTYIPTGENYYYCCAASYTVKKMLALVPQCAEAAALSIAMLDTMVQRQNEYGYWATEPGSEWLQGDYGISAGFYDTRFNTDLVEILINAEQKFGPGMFTEPITRYLGFYLQLADANHLPTENGGWLIPDYWHPVEHTTPHTSLNHQASECLVLYHAADLLDRDDLRSLADRMLKAIEDTGENWVMPNHNLYYSVKPDGTYVEGDYPYLTYNDLYYLRAYLTGFGEAPNEMLTLLMNEKLQWMRSSGVTGYETD